MLRLDQKEIAIFDCDGVLLDSNHIKMETFRWALNGEAVEDIEHLLDYHKQRGGVSRYVKLQYYYRDFKRYPNFEVHVKTALDRFSEYANQGLLAAPTVPGVLLLLDKLDLLGVRCYVISGSDQEELREVLKLRGLSERFVSICGSPVNKQDHLGALAQSGRPIHPGIYFGDARSDFEAALAYDLEFVFIAYNSDWKEGVSVCAAERCTVLHNSTR